jgi:hypothetical protein
MPSLVALQPPHLRRLPGAVVADIVATACGTLGRHMPLAVAQALTRLLDSHRAPDARALADACQAAGAIGLAAAIDQALLEDSHHA